MRGDRCGAMKTSELRRVFLEYFAAQDHVIVPSSSLVPQDASLLFTNSGMVQFKDLFLGLESRSYQRATSSQRCVRAGGKHNDLENVGYTARHHTFFEMLGNFSFGAYFKQEAIQYAWDFLTKVLKIPAERLWITVFEEDQEAERLWFDVIGIDQKRFSRCGAKDNFWSMGDTGPCGPCSEIFYDHGPSIPGGPPGSVDADGDRYVEIWNLVFMQFNRDAAGVLSPLPKPSVDTGMGLERIAAVMQGVHSNYEIDLFTHLIQSIRALGLKADAPLHSLRAVADHIRSCSFMIADGVLPGNEGRSYVLRRIIRRAIRHGHALGLKEPFFHRLVAPLVAQMGESYPLLVERMAAIQDGLYQEELQFSRTLEQGLKILEEALPASGKTRVLPGTVLFKLYDTYGFPVDLTADIARERGISLEMDSFEQAMEAQKARGRQAQQFAVQYQAPLNEGIPLVSGFIGYESLATEATVMALCRAKADVEGPMQWLEQDAVLPSGTWAGVVLDHTPFYAEAGGQVGDAGLLSMNQLSIRQNQGTSTPSLCFEVHNTQKIGTRTVHYGILQAGSLRVGTQIYAAVDQEKREATARNHSATHLLHAVLRQVLGSGVAQKGSRVEAARLRFDFSNGKALTRSQLQAIESMVNQKILENTLIETEVLGLEEALASGATALFGEKYGSEVRVLSMGGMQVQIQQHSSTNPADSGVQTAYKAHAAHSEEADPRHETQPFSVELCGGTHATRTGDLGLFKITGEFGVAAGVRRIEAITGSAVLAEFQNLEGQWLALAESLKCAPDRLAQRTQQLLQNQRHLEKALADAQSQALKGDQNIAQEIRVIRGHKVLIMQSPIGDIKALCHQAEALKDQWGLSVLLVAGHDAAESTKLPLVALVDKSCQAACPAARLMQRVAECLGGQGGGRADRAQGAGTQPERWTEAISIFNDFLETQLETVSQ